MQDTNLISNVPCPDKYVGYADLPNQIFRHCVMNGFDFNLLVVALGESGLGKSTFINSVFATEVYVNAKYAEKIPPISSQTMEVLFYQHVRSSTITILEKGIPLRLTMIDTPGFGDCVNNSECGEKILKCIRERNEEYLNWEASTPRVPMRDTRVHCVIYFVSPTGHRLKQIDIQMLMKLHDKANVIPVIARADSLASEDLLMFKKRILDDIRFNAIKIYDFPSAVLQNSDDLDSFKDLMKHIPFSIVSSTYSEEINNKIVRCLENPVHSDFVLLKNLILRTCATYLVETTHNIMYETYRSKHLASSQFGSAVGGSSNPLEVVEMENARQQVRLEEMRKEFEEKLFKHKRENEEKLIETEKKYNNRIIMEKEDLDKMSLGASSGATSVMESSRISKEAVY
ncbi:LOW QUALITY PROTEIN: hypothetical protein MXB_521 [Myxobolus squamalis]|nr:LOW QUALITY PROTEIN: hypothetical protein MXB_521 [Myxobolus squamalis]